ncbi:ATP-grasp domain-containing protein [Streptomyces graminilatus]|uniref:ATP-grasp domain-containing protein n=1 Tax=Streptomyces graminilatus TaxID=1464070 RepID=UPI0006E16758|nr:ATP-grasp domain-containing protein [Streptomyces graminilatus]
MTFDQPAVLLVDPTHTGAGYKAAARDLGFLVASLYTCDYTATAPGHAEGDDLSYYADDPDQAVRLVTEAGLSVRAVVPAMEVSTHLADRIAELLNLPGNDHSLADARRNKAAMRERARQAGLRIPEFHLVNSPDDIASAAHDIGFPAILKPTSGAGSQGVTLLPDAEALRDLSGLETHDAFDMPITEWLVERYIRGRQFSVNFYSFEGEHRLVDIWEFLQPDDRDYDFPIWDNVQIDTSHPDWHRVEQYVREVLDAYGIERGPSHTEVKCSEDGVHLLEVAARLPGGPMVGTWADHGNIRPFHEGIRCFLGERPAMFDTPVSFSARCGALAIRNDEAPGTLVAIHGLDAVHDLPGIDELLVSYQPGDHVPVTRDDLTIPFGAYVSAADGDEVLRTLAAIRSLVSLEIKRS